jgi:hypothetical protein
LQDRREVPPPVAGRQTSSVTLVLEQVCSVIGQKIANNHAPIILLDSGSTSCLSQGARIERH